MVGQCTKLYESDSACGSLYITVDDSKFFLNFNYSIKLLLDVKMLDKTSCATKNGDIVTVSNEQYDSCDVISSEFGIHEDLSQYNQLSTRCTSSIGKTSKSFNKGVKGSGRKDVRLKTPCADSDLTEDISIQINHTNDSSKTLDHDMIITNSNGNDYKGKKRKTNNADAVTIKEMSASQKMRASHAESKTNVNSDSDFNHQYSYESDDTDSIQKEDEGENHLDGADISVSHNSSKTTTSVNNASGQKISTCRDCYTNFESTQALKDHRKVKTSDIKCDECLEVFQYQAFLQVHKISNHGSTGALFVQKDNQYWYKCNMCGALAESLIKLQIHNLVHTGEGAFQCCLCSRQFWEMKDLSEHVTQSHRLSWKVRCWTCNKWFENRAARARHKINCSRFKCHLCNEVFTHKTIRNQHFNDVHPNEVLKCELCKHMFSSKEELDIHTNNHSKRKKKQCPTCGLLFNDVKRHMLTHKNTSELSESDFIYCDKCPERYSNQSSYNRHQRLKHPPDNSYKCTNCPKSFGHHEPLRRHMRRCKPLLSHSCQLCGKKYGSADELSSHIQSHSNDNDTRSIRSNCNDNSFHCPLCTQPFVCKSSLDTHVQVKHPHFISKTLISPITASESVTIKNAQDSTAPTTYDNTPFVYSTNGLMEAVIQGITDLANTPAPLKF